jgi:nucleoside-diphosphate-sugar epimerase
MTHYLQDDGWEVRGTDITWNTAGAPNFEDRNKRFDLIIHAAARGPHRRAIDSAPSHFPYNVGLDASMFAWVAETQQPRMVYLSSSAVYSDELNYPGPQPFVESLGFTGEAFDRYGEAKRFGERMAKAVMECGTKVTIVRPFSGYGTDQTSDFPFRAFLDRARRADDPFKIWGSADQVRDWIHIDDICRAIMELAENQVTKPVNLCTGIGTSMRELAELMMTRAGYKAEIEVDTSAPMGVQYRVGDPRFLKYWYTPRISIAEGVNRAFKGA